MPAGSGCPQGERKGGAVHPTPPTRGFTTLKKLLLSALVAGTMFAGAGAALAEKPAEPGREHGLCTAFFNGQKNGHEKQNDRNGSYPGPFQELLDSAPDGSDENDTGGDVADLFEACNEVGIGGNPDENGRFTTCYTDDDADPATHNCDD